MRAFLQVVVTLSIVGSPLMIAFGQGGGGEPPPICGLLEESLCCSGNNPGGCTCAPAGHDCRCSNTGTLIECHQGNWNYVADPNGDSLALGASQACSSTSACLSSLETGQSCGGLQGCTPPCSWIQTSSVPREPWASIGNCTNGQVN